MSLSPWPLRGGGQFSMRCQLLSFPIFGPRILKEKTRAPPSSSCSVKEMSGLALVDVF